MNQAPEPSAAHADVDGLQLGKATKHPVATQQKWPEMQQTGQHPLPWSSESKAWYGMVEDFHWKLM